MTNPAAVPDEVKDFTTTRRRHVTTFKIDGQPVTATQPKTAWQIGLIRKYPNASEDEFAFLTVDETLEKVFDPESLKHLRARLDDDDDDFDYDDIVAVGRWLREQWNDADPTGQPTGSSGRRSRTGGRSTARAR